MLLLALSGWVAVTAVRPSIMRLGVPKNQKEEETLVRIARLNGSVAQWMNYESSSGGSDRFGHVVVNAASVKWEIKQTVMQLGEEKRSGAADGFWVARGVYMGTSKFSHI